MLTHLGLIIYAFSSEGTGTELKIQSANRKKGFGYSVFISHCLRIN